MSSSLGTTTSSSRVSRPPGLLSTATVFLILCLAIKLIPYFFFELIQGDVFVGFH